MEKWKKREVSEETRILKKPGRVDLHLPLTSVAHQSELGRNWPTSKDQMSPVSEINTELEKCLQGEKREKKPLRSESC